MKFKASNKHYNLKTAAASRFFNIRIVPKFPFELIFLEKLEKMSTVLKIIFSVVLAFSRAFLVFYVLFVKYAVLKLEL